MKKALIFYGGWKGHTPELTSEYFANELEAHDFEVERTDTMDCLDDAERLTQFDLIIPCWTMGQLSQERFENLEAAIAAGTGLGGFHGGMGDAFRENLWYQWLVGGQFVQHPPEMRDYTVRLTQKEHPILASMPETFTFHSEVYYMMIDPAIEVLAETDYETNGRSFSVPVAWVKPWKKGRVFYSALGHSKQEFIDFPPAKTMTLNGLLWAARSK